MSDWISINDALPPVGKIVEYQGQGEHVRWSENGYLILPILDKIKKTLPE